MTYSISHADVTPVSDVISLFSKSRYLRGSIRSVSTHVPNPIFSIEGCGTFRRSATSTGTRTHGGAARFAGLQQKREVDREVWEWRIRLSRIQRAVSRQQRAVSSQPDTTRHEQPAGYNAP